MNNLSALQTARTPPASLRVRAAAELERRKRTGTVDSRYRQFQRAYRDDWVAFVHDCIDWRGDQRPAPYQDEVLAELVARGRAAVRGPHGLGKTALAAWVTLAFALTRDSEDWKAPTTASAWRQLVKYLWPELHKWARRLKWDRIGRQPFDARSELLTLNLKLETGEAFAVASDNADLIEGAHADRLLYIFDEAKAIPDATFDAAEGAFAGAGGDTFNEAYALVISTPGEPAGRFYDIHKRRPGYEDWWVRHVTLEEAVAAGRISREWAEQRRAQWGEGSAVYQNRVAGEFAASDEDGVVPLAWIERANERWQEWMEAGRLGKLVAIGVDVGGGSEGGDKTVLAPVYDGYKVDTLRKYPRGDLETATMETAGRTKGMLDANPGSKAIVDVIGIGAGVYHRLKEQKCSTSAFNAAEATRRRDRTNEFGFRDKRSAAWWIMREMLDPLDGVEIALPPDDELTGELTAPRWRVASGARIQVESKDEVRKRIKRSTDCADAVIQGTAGQELVEPQGVYLAVLDV
jgi:hypothetical protein